MILETNLRSDTGEILAVVRVIRNPNADNTATEIVGPVNCREILNALRALPISSVFVTAYYPATDRTVVLNQHPTDSEYNMDFSKIYTEKQAAKVSDKPTRLVAPAPNVIPEDSVITFTVVESIRDVLDAPAQSVLLFEEDNLELLQVIVDHSTLFGFNVSLLSGLPTADYSPQFEAKTYNLERVSYASFVNDLIEAKRVASALVDESQTDYEKERKQFTRKSGHVKELKGTKMAGLPDSEEQTEAD